MATGAVKDLGLGVYRAKEDSSPSNREVDIVALPSLVATTTLLCQDQRWEPNHNDSNDSNHQPFLLELVEVFAAAAIVEIMKNE